MKTIEAIRAGRCMLVRRSNGQAYIADSVDPYKNALLVATGPAGLEAIADGLREMADRWRKEQEAKGE